MNTQLLGDEQKQIFASLTKKNKQGSPSTAKPTDVVISEDTIGETRVETNLRNIVTLEQKEFDVLKEFLKSPVTKIFHKGVLLQEARYANIKTVWQVFCTDWPYFPKKEVRCCASDAIRQTIGTHLNFVINFSSQQRKELMQGLN